jgi:hypothetical protein
MPEPIEDFAVAETVAAPAAQPKAAPPKLDDIMIAMDVVDMVRHREDLIKRELNEAGREAELIERLREIYRQQGITVPDSVLADGVKALKDSRFTYDPPPKSWKRTALEMWTRRGKVGAWAGVLMAGLLSTCGYHHYTVTRPAEIAQEQVRVELTETLPKQVRQGHADVVKASTETAAKQRADQILADGERAIRDKDRAGMTKASTEMARLREDVLAEYTLTIVSRPGETTGVWRRPPAGSQTRNYYIIVEPLTAAGGKVKVPIRNEETGQTDLVDKFGVRVPQATFDAVAADKRDDGIVQKNHYGVKRRGSLSVDYQMPFDGGMITKW